MAAPRILLLASDAQFAAELHRHLERAELADRVRETADQAIAALGDQAVRIDLVILDSSVAMADLLRVYERLRDSDLTASVPIVFSRSSFVAAPGSEGGGDVYLGPSVSAGEVAQRARALLVFPAAPAPAPVQPADPGADASAAVEPPPSRSGARTALIGILLGILLGVAVLAFIWMGGLPVTLPHLGRLLNAQLQNGRHLFDSLAGWLGQALALVAEA